MASETMLDYVIKQRETFDEVPFNNVDSLILSTIVYLLFERGPLGTQDPNVPLPLAAAMCGAPRESFIDDCCLNCKEGMVLYLTLLESPRFMSLTVSNYETCDDEQAEKQFAALTFHLPDGGIYVCYRGTDGTINGWKEDLNFCYTINVPGQVQARNYLEYMAATGPRYILVGGHSKGGNLAEYAALTCDDGTYNLISRVFSHDGPAFAQPPSERLDSPEYAIKLDKTVPESSVIGMLLEQRDTYRILEAKGALLAQHSPINWLLKGSGFAYTAKINATAMVLYGTLNSWAHSCTQERRKRLVDAIFDVLGATGAYNVGEINDDPIKNMRLIKGAVDRLPDDLRDDVGNMFREMFRLLRGEAVEKAKDNLPFRKDAGDKRDAPAEPTEPTEPAPDPIVHVERGEEPEKPLHVVVALPDGDYMDFS